MFENLYLWGSHFVWSFQAWGQWLAAPMQFFSFLGTETFFFLLLPLIYWCFDAYLGLRIGAVLLISSGINAALKLAFHTPRPFWYDAGITRYEMSSTYGFPSGHSQVSASVWGMAAHDLKKPWFRWVAVFAVLFIGLSRLYLGVHFPHDVLVGWALGLLVLWAVLALWPRVAAHLQTAGRSHRIMAAALGSLAILFINWLPWYLFRHTSIPFEWSINAGFALAPHSLNSGLTSAGAFFGMFLGYTLAEPLHFTPQNGSWRDKALRYLVGMLVLLALWRILGLFFPRSADLSGWALRYLRYALIGWWISDGAPRFFRHLGIG